MERFLTKRGDAAMESSETTKHASRVALVTGASSGIGAAAASALAQDVGVVVIHYRANASGARVTADAVTAAGATPVLHQADLTRPDEVQAMTDAILARCGRVD